MTASKHVKNSGLKSLSQMSEISNKSRCTLENWYQDNPQLFDVVIAGCLLKSHNVRAILDDLSDVDYRKLIICLMSDLEHTK